jgi:predicted kinase
MTAPTLSPALVLLCGASFSGKSSLGHVLADGLGAQIVSLDAINGERGLRGGQGIPVSERAQTNAEAHQRVDELLSRGETVIVDDTSSPRFLRDQWRDTAGGNASGFLPVYLRAADALVLERLRANRHDLRRGDVADEVMRGHLASFEPPGIDEAPLTVDSAGYQNEVVLSTVRAALSTSPWSCRPYSSSPKDEA